MRTLKCYIQPAVCLAAAVLLSGCDTSVDRLDGKASPTRKSQPSRKTNGASEKRPAAPISPAEATVGKTKTSNAKKTVTSKPETRKETGSAGNTGIRVVTPKAAPPPGTPRWDPKGIQDFKLVERSGKTVTRADLLGKPFIAAFIFTSCRGPCANITKEMYELQEWLKTNKIDVRLVTLSVDPKRDTPDVLKRYAEVMGAEGDRWWFLTGEKDVIFSLIRKSFLEPVRETPDAPPGFEIAHTTGLMLVDQSGRVIGEYNAKYPKPMNALRRRLQAYKKTGRFPDEKPAKAAPGDREKS